MTADPDPSHAAAPRAIRPMRRLAWLSDLHLNFVTPRHVERLCRSVVESGANAVLLTGDIGEAHDVEGHLEALDAGLGLPLYFVLGNHDFYGGGIARVRAGIQDLCARSPRLTYLTQAGAVALTGETGMNSPPRAARSTSRRTSTARRRS